MSKDLQAWKKTMGYFQSIYGRQLEEGHGWNYVEFMTKTVLGPYSTMKTKAQKPEQNEPGREWPSRNPAVSLTSLTDTDAFSSRGPQHFEPGSSWQSPGRVDINHSVSQKRETHRHPHIHACSPIQKGHERNVSDCVRLLFGHYITSQACSAGPLNQPSTVLFMGDLALLSPVACFNRATSLQSAFLQHDAHGAYKNFTWCGPYFIVSQKRSSPKC